MKFLRPRPFSGQSLEQALQFLRIDLAKIFSDMVEGFKHWRLEENFDSFKWEGTIAAGSTVQIPNRLRSKTVKWWPVRIRGDSRLVEDADKPFSEDFVYIKNASGDATTATLVFMR